MLELSRDERVAIWNRVAEALETFADELPELRVSPPTDPTLTRALLESVDSAEPMAPSAAIELALEGLRHTGARCSGRFGSSGSSSS